MGKGNHRSINAEGSSGKVRKTISGSLLKILLPITAVSIIILQICKCFCGSNIFWDKHGKYIRFWRKVAEKEERQFFNKK